MRYLWLLILLAFSSLRAQASVIATRCEASLLNAGATEWGKVDCVVETTDAGVLLVSISSTTARMRANGDGSIQSGDLPGIRTAMQNAYRASVAAERSAQAARAAEEAKKKSARFTLTPAQVE